MTQPNRIYIGPDGGTWVPIDTANAHAAFALAIAQAPPEGGLELFVTPGTQPYVFGAEVVVDKPDTTIHFSGAAELTFRAGQHPQSPLAMFRITSPGFRCRGARVVHAIQEGINNVAHRSVFLVEIPPSTTGAGRASFQDCNFEVGNENSFSILDFFCIRAKGSDSADPRQGLDVRGCTFFFTTLGNRQAQAWQGEDPFGMGAVRAQDTRGILIVRNTFRGNIFQQGLAHTGPMIYLLRAPESVIATNVLEAMDLLLTPDASAGGSLIRIAGEASSPGHHAVFCNNVLEPIRAQHVVELLGARSDVVAFSNFGRLGPGDGALRTRPSVGGAEGHSLVVFGNNFHNVQPIYMIVLESLAHAAIDGQVFYQFEAGEIPLQLVGDTCRDVHFGPSQARRAL